MSDCKWDSQKKDVGECPTEAKPLRIMLLGRSGAGKSSSGNTILGRQVFNSELKLENVTVICDKAEGTVGDVRVAVIDTPGLFETQRNKEEIVREIMKCVKLQEPGPHAFVYVVPVGRLTQEDRNTNALIEAKFGPRVWDYTIVLFTHGDRLGGKTVNDIITKSEDILRNFLRKCGGGFHVFNNKDTDDLDQVTGFMSKIETLLALNGGKHYETHLYPKKERKTRQRHEIILTERLNAIGAEEAQLRERYRGDELDEKVKKLWRKEDENARTEAEKQSTRDLWKMYGLVVLVISILIMLVKTVCGFFSDTQKSIN